MEYKITFGRDYEELEKKVQKDIDSGWTPCGGVAHDSRSGWLYQAMTSTYESRKEHSRPIDMSF